MKRMFGRSLAILLGLTLMAGFAVAEESKADVSLENEIDRYLEQSSPKWDDPKTLRAFWKTGLNLATGDGNFQLKVGGRIMWDNYWISADDNAKSDYPGVDEDRTFFRRLRFYMEGTIHKNTFYKLQIDFASQEEGEDGDPTGKLVASLKDAFIGLRNLGPLGVIVGHFKESFSFEEMTSSKYITFMERSSNNSAFTPARNTGWQVFGSYMEQRLAWWAGIFKTTADDAVAVNNDGYAFTARIAGIALKNDDMILAVDFAFSFRNTSSSRFRARPGISGGQRLVDTGTFASDDETRYNIGVAFVWQAFSVQGEYFLTEVSVPAGGNSPSFSGFYLFASWFITGESRPFKGSSMSFGRVKPKRNFWDGEGGPGAWEIALRYDWIDLTDDVITGGEQTTITGGVNWHWNPNTRMMFNIIFSEQDPNDEGSKSDVTTFAIRWQIDF